MSRHTMTMLGQSHLTRRSLLKVSALAVGATALNGLLAACGDDDDTGGAGSAATSTEGGTAASVTTTTGSGIGTTAGETHMIEMNADNKFDPEQLTVKVGDTITWRIVGAMPHSSTCDPAKATDASNAQLPEGAKTWDSGILTTEGSEFSFTVEVAGEYTYFCIPHEMLGMIGRFTAEA